MTKTVRDLLAEAGIGRLPGREDAGLLAAADDLPTLMAAAARLRDQGHGPLVSYSRKVFIPLTHLCRDVCHYCTFARPPRKGERAYMTADAMLAVARAGAAAGCKEALFTLGDRPERRYRVAQEELAALGHDSTLSYLAAMADLVFRETGLLPHLNPGVMDAADYAALRPLSVSMGIMLESAAERLCEKGGPHWGSPDKRPAVRLESMRLAGEAAVPFTSGILIGIGETRAERVDALLALRDLHDAHGHLQEIIVQNFRAKPETRMAAHPDAPLDELLWTIAVARILFGPAMNIQAPPNLSPGVLRRIVDAGINDWGGVSPVTPDFVNPEAPWPHLDRLAAETADAGKLLVERLAIYPAYALAGVRWLAPAMCTSVLRAIDGQGFARVEDWTPGSEIAPPAEDLSRVIPGARSATRDPGLSGSGEDGIGSRAQAWVPGSRFARPGMTVKDVLAKAMNGADLDESEIVALFQARGAAFGRVCAAADALRRRVKGDAVTYVVNRNINYTNVCYFKCQFCAFSKGKLSENLRGRPYDLAADEIRRRTEEAWERGATEVCMQGGIHPDYTGATYLEILQGVKAVAPDMHVHAFTPLEVWQGAETMGLSVPDFLARLKQAGLGTLPGTAAEVLDDEVRAIICPDKVSTDEWLSVMADAHAAGLRSTATIMYGHVDRYEHWARHLLRIRNLQKRTGGFTEFVPLPFVHMEAPIYLKGRARKGPTFREAVLMHAVARLALHPHIGNIQASWVKMGPQGVAACLAAGANDLGGTLMNETITRAAGASHGQEMPPERMEAMIRSLGRTPRQRTTLYGEVSVERAAASFDAAPLAEIVNTPARKYDRLRASQARNPVQSTIE